MKKILLSLSLVFVFTCIKAQSYQTIAAGNWSSSSTWGGGSVPPTDITSTRTVNINHRVVYDIGSDLNIEGGQVIITDTLRFPNDGSSGTGRSIFVKAKDGNTGLLSVNFGGLIMPVTRTDGSNNSGNIKAEGGRIEFLYSYIEIGQNAEATSDSKRKFINTCVKLGENYMNSFSTDTLQGVCIELGMHGSGNFQNDGGTIRFNMTAVLLRGVSGSFANSSVPTSKIFTYENPPYAILALDVPGHLENSGVWNATIGEYCVEGSITGSYPNAIDFTGPENCAWVDEAECSCNPLGAPLPVSLHTFNAQRERMNVELAWETLSEVNNRGFHVQRKTGSGDWQNTGFVHSKAQSGNSNSLLGYEFTDYNPAKGISQYRLKQVDIENKIAYSQIRAVRGEGQDGGIIIYPNPSSDGKVNLVFDDVNGVRNLSLMDMNGRKLKQWRNITNNHLQIDNLATGFYSVYIENIETGDLEVKKIVIVGR